MVESETLARMPETEGNHIIAVAGLTEAIVGHHAGARTAMRIPSGEAPAGRNALDWMGHGIMTDQEAEPIPATRRHALS